MTAFFGIYAQLPLDIASYFDEKRCNKEIAVATKNSSVCCVPDDVPALSGSAEDDLSLLAKALGHPARVRLLSILIERGVCLSGSLADEIDLAPSTVSEHLRILKESGLVQGTIDGPRRCYCVNPKALDYFKSLVKKL